MEVRGHEANPGRCLHSQTRSQDLFSWKGDSPRDPGCWILTTWEEFSLLDAGPCLASSWMEEGSGAFTEEQISVLGSFCLSRAIQMGQPKERSPLAKPQAPSSRQGPRRYSHPVPLRAGWWDRTHGARPPAQPSAGSGAHGRSASPCTFPCWR